MKQKIYLEKGIRPRAKKFEVTISNSPRARQCGQYKSIPLRFLSIPPLKPPPSNHPPPGSINYNLPALTKLDSCRLWEGSRFCINRRHVFIPVAFMPVHSVFPRVNSVINIRRRLYTDNLVHGV